MFVIVGAPYEPSREGEFVAGDSIKVELDPDVWKLMQNGHGGWNDLMGMVRLSVCRNIEASCCIYTVGHSLNN